MKWQSTLLALLLFSTITLSCQNFFPPGVQGEGPVIERSLDLKEFESILLSIAADVNLSQGLEQKVVVRGQENILDLLTLDIREGEWAIGFKEPASSYEKLVIDITLPEIKNLGISGSGDIIGTNFFTDLEDVSLVISGSGDIELELRAESIDCTVSGSGNMRLTGRVLAQKINITGSGEVDSDALRSDRCQISITGSGDSKVQVMKALDISIVGSGDVYYWGSARVHTKIIGSGDVFSKVG